MAQLCHATLFFVITFSVFTPGFPGVWLLLPLHWNSIRQAPSLPFNVRFPSFGNKTVLGQLLFPLFCHLFLVVSANPFHYLPCPCLGSFSPLCGAESLACPLNIVIPQGAGASLIEGLLILVIAVLLISLLIFSPVHLQFTHHSVNTEYSFQSVRLFMTCLSENLLMIFAF